MYVLWISSRLCVHFLILFFFIFGFFLGYPMLHDFVPGFCLVPERDEKKLRKGEKIWSSVFYGVLI